MYTSLESIVYDYFTHNSVFAVSIHESVCEILGAVCVCMLFNFPSIAADDDRTHRSHACALINLSRSESTTYVMSRCT